MVGQPSPTCQRKAAQTPSADEARRTGFVSARDAATALGVSERTVRRAIASGLLPARKRGRSFEITPEALAGFGARRGTRADDPAAAIDSLQTAPAPPNLAVLPRGLPFPRHALPRPLTRFVGREREIARIAERLRLADVRLVTLTGPGGVGKTRLALRVAEAMTDEFAGIAFVSLETVSGPDLVLPAIARALGVRESSERPLAVGLAAAVRDHRLLLVLDNVEHLLGAAVDLARLLADCPGLTVLATSREPLRLSGEYRIATLPLALPAAGDALPPEGLSAIEAIALFIERARQVRPDFALDAGNAATVHEICRRLDGLPLAIELAAPWLRLLAPEALLSRMEQRLPLLTGGAADMPTRFQTMRQAIAWSFDLLAERERQFLCRLAVFSSGFTLEAAEAVGGMRGEKGGEGGRFAGEKTDGAAAIGSSSPPAGPRAAPLTPSLPPSTLDLLAALADKSLVQLTPTEGRESRFALMETVREFALEELAASGDLGRTRQAHAGYFRELAEAAARDAGRAGDSGWMRRLTAERPNLQSALDWLEQAGAAGAALEMTGALWHYWYRLGDLGEGRSRLERALAAAPADVDAAAWARALRGAGVLAWQSADYARSRERLDAALAAYRTLGDRTGVAWSLNSLGCLCATLSETEQAETSLSESLALFRELGDAVGSANLTCNLGELAAAKGEHALAVARLETGLAMWRALGDRVGAVRAQVYLGRALLAQGEIGHAEAVLLEALAAIRAIDYRQILPVALRTMAQLATRRTDAAAAARWYGAADGIMSALGMELPATQRGDYERAMAVLREWVGDTAFATAWSAGHTDPGGVVDAALGTWDAAARTTERSGEARGGDIAPFTSRQRDVLRLLALGRSDKEIAEALFISRTTASKHVAAILTRLKADSRTAAVATAIRLGLA